MEDAGFFHQILRVYCACTPCPGLTDEDSEAGSGIRVPIVSCIDRHSGKDGGLFKLGYYVTFAALLTKDLGFN